MYFLLKITAIKDLSNKNRILIFPFFGGGGAVYTKLSKYSESLPIPIAITLSAKTEKMLSQAQYD